jgi:phosphate butyryltransferase
MITSFEEIVKAAKTRGKKRIVLAAAEDIEALEAIERAHREALAEPILVGDKDKLAELCKSVGLDMGKLTVYHEPDPAAAAIKAVDLVRNGEADALMKGLVDTSKLLKAVLDKDKGLRSSELLTHVFLISSPTYHKILFLTDVAMVVAPDLGQKILIIKNAVKVANGLGIDKPKVAILCATEKVNYEHMPATIDAAVLSKMGDRGQLGSVIVDGPLALDNALSIEACKIKKIDSPVGGDADILVVPDIEAGNMLYKGITRFQPDHQAAGIIMGAKCPVILVSRADSADSKFYSIALANLLS